MKINWTKIIYVCKVIGVVLPVITALFTAWMFVDARHAHQTELLEIRRQLELRDNENYISIHKIVTQESIGDIIDTIDNYATIDALNGDEPLSPAQIIRKEKLERNLITQQELLNDWTEAERALRLQLSGNNEDERSE